MKKYRNSSEYIDSGAESFARGKYIIERIDDSSLHGTLRVLRYYNGLDRFGELFREDLNVKLFWGIENNIESPQQLDKTIRDFERSNDGYLTYFIKDRMGRIWLTEEDRQKEVEIANFLSDIRNF